MNRKTHTFIFCLAVGLNCGAVTAEEKALPYEVVQLQSQRKARIARIDAIYRKELTALKEKYTKAGDLEKANLVVGILNDLQNGVSTSAVPSNDAELRDFLRDTKWVFDNGWVVTFHSDGQIRKSWGVMKPVWKVEKMEVSVPAESSSFRFLKNFTQCIYKDNRGVTRTGKMMKEP